MCGPSSGSNYARLALYGVSIHARAARKVRRGSALSPARRHLCDNANTVGLTPDDQQLTEEILRALIIVWNQQRPADFDIDEQQEGWPNYTGDPGQRQIRAHYEVTCGLTVLADPISTRTSPRSMDLRW